jgi:hypothetical protein
MSKTVYFFSIIFMLTAGCSSNEQKAGKEKQITSGSSKSTSAAASYDEDSLYKLLPQNLVDLKASGDIMELLAQDWILEDDKESLRDAEVGILEVPVRTFSLASDFTMIKNCRNAMDEGKWNFDEASKVLRFKYNNGSQDVYKLRAIAADEMKLTNIGIKSETVLKFVSDAGRYINKEDDPFYSSNNQWRIKPLRPETDEQVKKRLKENIHFFILYYKDAIARKASLVSFYGFPSCLNWYSGGIYIKNEKEISEKWKTCFYNSSQAMKAYKMMGDVLSKKYNWPKGNANWIKKNLFVLEQMYQQL